MSVWSKTECSGKSTLLKHILLLYGTEKECNIMFKNNEYSIINSIVSCVYNTLNENNFKENIIMTVNIMQN